MATLSDNALAYASVKKWADLFKAGQERIEDDQCSSQLSTTLTEENRNW